MTETRAAGELMYEIDSLYVSTEMILSGCFREPPLDGLLPAACLLHFRVVWEFFYRPKKEATDVVVRDYVPAWMDPDEPARLKEIRKWLNAMLAHLATRRVDPAFKAGEITMDDIILIRKHTRDLFASFWTGLTVEQRESS